MLGPVVCDIEGPELTEADRLRISHPLVGMVILFSRNYRDPEQLTELCRQIHEVKPGLLISVDHEGGRVQRFREGFIQIPAMREYGEQFAYNTQRAMEAARCAGYVMASELLACGVDLTFAPVLDLDWGHSDIIGERAFAKSPVSVAMLAGAVIAGMRHAGMANCGKHFPGHGWVRADSHLALPCDERCVDDIEGDDAVPYRLLRDELVSVMTAHVLYEQMDDQPASFSRTILQGLLREKVEFKGFVFSDDLSMKGAVSVGSVVERAHKALAAGCDGLIICNDPEATDELLAGLNWTMTEDFSRRSAALEPTHPHESLAALRSTFAYAQAVSGMQLVQM